MELAPWVVAFGRPMFVVVVPGTRPLLRYGVAALYLAIVITRIGNSSVSKTARLVSKKNPLFRERT